MSLFVSIRLIESDLGKEEAGFGLPGQKEGELVFVFLIFGRRLAGEEGGAAAGGRQPPSSPMKLGRRWVASLAEC